jgi:hypothetical protein
MQNHEKGNEAHARAQTEAPGFRVVDHSERPVLHGKEMHGRIEVVRPDGTKEIKPYFQRTVELDDSCVQVSWLAPSRLGPITVISCIRRGHTEGGLRRDRREMTVILADGTVHRAPEVEVAVRVPSPFTGMSAPDATRHIHEYLTELFAAVGRPATPEDAVRAVEDFKRRRWGPEPEK